MSIKVTRRQFGLGAIGAAAIVSQVGLSKPAKAKVSLKVGSAANEEYVGVKFTKLWLAEVSKRTGGEIDGQVFAGTLGGEQSILQATALGTLDVYQGAYTGLRQFDIFYLASLCRDYDQAVRVINGSIRPQLNKLIADQYKGHLLGVGRAGAFGLYTKDKIDSWAGFKGRKLRAGQIEGVLEGLKTLGANPTPIPFNEAYSALQQGVVDGQVTLSSLVITQKYYEVTKYAYANDFGLGFDKIVVANRVWEKISPAHQKIMADTFNEMEPTFYAKPVADAKLSDAKRWEELNGPGSVITLDNAELARLMEPTCKKLADEIFGPGSWDKIKSA